MSSLSTQSKISNDCILESQGPLLTIPLKSSLSSPKHFVHFSMTVRFLFLTHTENVLLLVIVCYGLYLELTVGRMDPGESPTPVLRVGFSKDRRGGLKLYCRIFKKR